MSKYLILDCKYDGNIELLHNSETIINGTEYTYFCPFGKNHKITSNGKKLFCKNCGIWWNKQLIK